MNTFEKVLWFATQKPRKYDPWAELQVRDLATRGRLCIGLNNGRLVGESVRKC